jgi:hypothetical protein
MNLDLPPVEQPGFSAAASSAPSSIDVRLAGNADAIVHAQIERYLNGLHLEACRLRASEVKVDVRDLTFINSSCLMLFVDWLTRLRDMEPGQQYRIVVSSNSKQLWQRRSFSVLANVAKGLVTVQ